MTSGLRSSTTPPVDVLEPERVAADDATATVAGRRVPPLFLNALTLFGGQIGRLAVQGAYFVIAARILGVAGFGAFTGILALVSVFGPFASLGAMNLMVRHVARNPAAASSQLRGALLITGIGGSLLTAVVVASSPELAPKGSLLLVVILIGFSEMVASRAIDVAGLVFTPLGQMRQAAGYPVMLATGRLLTAGVVVLLDSHVGILAWSAAYAASSTLVAVGLCVRSARRLGAGTTDWRSFLRDWRQGLLFSCSLAAQTVYNDIDKAMLSRLSTLTATGTYSAAYRVIEFSFAPMRALLASTYPKFFREGERGLRGAVKLARRLFWPSLAVNGAAAAGLFLFAPVIPLVLGKDFGGSVDVVRALAILPLFRTVHYLAADALTGADRQGVRTIVQGGTAAFNVILNIALIPTHGLWGAVVATILTDGSLAVLMAVTVVVLLRRERDGDEPTDGDPFVDGAVPST